MYKSDLEFYNNLFVYLIPILQFFILLIPFLGSDALYDSRNVFYRRFSFRGYSLLFLGIIVIVLTVRQSQVTSKLNELNNTEAERKSDIRDSITRKTYLDADYKTKVMLAKFGLEVNAQSDKIVKILKDPNQRKVTVKTGENPFIELFDLKFDKVDSKIMSLSLTSYDATSYDVNAKVDIIAVIDDKLLLVRKNEILTDHLTITKGYKTTKTWKFDPPNVKKISYLYFHIHGTYKKDGASGKIITLEKYVGYDFKDTSSGYPMPSRDKIKELKKVINEN